jgi:ribonuclease HI
MSGIYAIRKGRKIGIFSEWSEVELLTKGYSGASFKSFKSFEDAQAYLAGESTTTTLQSLIKPITLRAQQPLVPPTTSVTKPQLKPTSNIRIFLKPKKPTDPIQLNIVRKVVSNPPTIDHRNPPAIENQSKQSLEDNLHEMKSTSVGSVEIKEPTQIPQVTEVYAPKKERVKLSIYCDGSCFGNGKKNALGGIGIYFMNPTYHRYNVSEPFTLDSTATNNKTEIYALKRTLDIICHLIEGNKDVIYEFEVYTDSQYTIKCLTEWMPNWIRKQWIKADGKPVQNVELLKSLSASYNKCRRQTQIKYAPGHTGRKDGNSYADELATDGTRKHPKYRKESETEQKNKPKFRHYTRKK